MHRISSLRALTGGRIAASVAVLLLLSLFRASAHGDPPNAASSPPAEESAAEQPGADAHRRPAGQALTAGQRQDAIRSLKKAYLASRDPALLLRLDAIYAALGDQVNQRYYLEKYLATAPADAPERPVAATRLARLLPPESPGDPAPKTWSHMPLDTVAAGKPVEVRVALPITYGIRVFLYYRSAAQAEFDIIEMTREGTSPYKTARIPAQVMRGTSFQYYLEARDRRGNVVHRSGSGSEPHVVLIEGRGTPMARDSENEPAPGGSAHRPSP